MKKIGTIVGGSLAEGLVMRVASEVQLETLKTGKFVSIIGHSYTFFSLVTNLTLEIAHQDILLFPPSEKETFLKEILQQKSMYATAELKPMLMLDKSYQVMPVKTIPAHFATVYEATNKEVKLIFGDEADTQKRYFNIGTPLDMDTPVCINLERLVERSTGIFGKTGTGKTFLTRLVLAGLMHTDKAVNLIFDMHSEYGLQARKEGAGNAFVKGLKTLFPGRVAIFSLDPESTRRRGSAADVELILQYQDIHVDDIISLQQELNLHSTALEAAYLIYAHYKHNWLAVLLAQQDLKEFANQVGAHAESIAALYRKLKRIERLPFFIHTKQNEYVQKSSVIDQMMEYIDKGISICVEFGNYTSSFCYLLISNIITRRIHAEYIAKTERFLGTQKSYDQPKQLMITIEEAHKFLNASAAKQTIFGTIAREMRKYYVSLLIVDQRPSGIDQEVISQLGTKIVAQLSDEKDIQAILTGVSGATTLRSVMASLDTKKQALVLGHAVAMPVVIKTREYDEHFYRAVSLISEKPINKLIEEIF